MISFVMVAQYCLHGGCIAIITSILKLTNEPGLKASLLTKRNDDAVVHF